ncbi:MAG: DNA mismatch repair protein MutS [Bacteroidales bacterium]|nr:DNA mismatch repair protein MutS [Bacteroidales bacterium]
MAAKKDTVTPLMKQYNEIKAKFPDTILLYRIGDFYETFGQDAVQTSEILNIVLTRRSGGGQDKLAGFPHHALDTYLHKLIKAGKRVAICEQTEDPSQVKGIVKREITEIVTPALAYNDGALSPGENNYLCAVFKKKNLYGLAFVDISTGEFLVSEGSLNDAEKLMHDFNIKEAVVLRQYERDFLTEFHSDVLTKTYDDWVFTKAFALDILKEVFSVEGVKGFGIEDMPLAVIAAGAALHYIKQTNHTQLLHLCNISRIDNSEYVWLDGFTIKNLEIVSSSNSDKTTLYNVLNHTTTPMGARLLYKWLLMPLKNKKQIEKRHLKVGALLHDDLYRSELSEVLSQIGDMERLTAKISVRRIQPNELYHFAQILECTEKINNILAYLQPNNTELFDKIETFAKLKTFILNALNEDAPNNINKPNIIKDGFNEQLDGYRLLAYNSEQIMSDILKKETENTGISTLKIGFNNVFGYYLEVTNTNKDKVPAEWQRKQTLANCERYITDDLKKAEVQILTAQENISSLERSLYNNVLEQISPYIARLKNASMLIAELDCILSFAIAAKEYNYVCPQMMDSDILHISKGRHPVIERMLDVSQQYIANDVYLDTTTQQIIIITGPNMSGKSAYLRQTALIVLMAQAGCYVPAKKAQIGIVDKIFTRVGASDNISSGESTFMVEMHETASILNNLSPHSLILLDEIGRGTSTYDGLSIAWAVTQYLHDNKNKPKVMFATHYHEMIDIEQQCPRIKNYHIAVKEIGDKIIFLRNVEKGGTYSSFGIHVGAMAGLPKQVIEIAEKMLDSLEKNAKKTEKNSAKSAKNAIQMSFIQLNDPLLEQIKDELLKVDIDNLTPIDALLMLNKIKKMVKNI